MSNFASGYVKYINHLEQINDAAEKNPVQMICEVEGAYRDCLQNVSRNFAAYHAGARLIMLSGPSSSGKTTTANLLRHYLGEMGHRAHIISLDDFYLGLGRAPRLPDGRYDYEAVEALDVQRIKNCLKNVIETGRFTVPHYDFTAGMPAEQEQSFEIAPNEVVIVEGLHALNPMFTKYLPQESVVRLYVSVKQQIKDANGEVLSPLDLRLIRRIVRDVQFRGTPAEGTLAMWQGVVAGEDKYIRPYRMSADYTVNSVHIYEPCVLRGAAIPLLREIEPDSVHYRKARALEAKLMRFEPINAELVPAGSMLREFLGEMKKSS